MNIRTLFLLTITAVQVYSQPEIPRFIYTEVQTFPRDSLFEICFTFKIPYNRVVFEKLNGRYSAGIQAGVELREKENGYISRDFKEKRISSSDFLETNSDEKYIQGLLTFKVEEGNYELFPVFTDVNTRQELKLPLIETPVFDNAEIKPLIVKNEDTGCSGTTGFAFGNFNGKIPFGNDDYKIIVPLAEKVDDLTVTVISNGRDTVLIEEVEHPEEGDFYLEECNEEVILGISENSDSKYFVLNDISRKLEEGPVKILVSAKGKVIDTIKTAVKWFNKPHSLHDPETAVNSLKYIEHDSVISRLLEEDEMQMYGALFHYWEKTDPTPETAYNELMEEYYARLDYAQSNFSILTGKNGTDTDRGQVYIRFGKPHKIERTSNEYGKVVETWIYKNPQRKFVFVDKNGIGEFSLQKG